MSYKKREIAHWNQGKSCKGTRKAKEKVYVDREIDEQIASQDESFRYRHVGKRKHDREAQLKNRLEWFRNKIQEWERFVKKHGMTHSSFLNYLRDGFKKTEKQLLELKP